MALIAEGGWPWVPASSVKVGELRPLRRLVTWRMFFVSNAEVFLLFSYPRCSMGLECLPTFWLQCMVNVCKYTMEPMGMFVLSGETVIIAKRKNQTCFFCVARTKRLVQNCSTSL